MMKRRKLIALCFAVISLITVGLIGYQKMPSGITWRMQLINLKLMGEIKDLSWSELIRMIKPNGIYWLEPMVDTKNPYSVIVNPYKTNNDIKQGLKIFSSNCMVCHGNHNNAAPDFLNDDFKHGSSDWALYRNITRGIPNTSMRDVELSEKDTWQVIAYIRTLANKTEIQSIKQTNHATRKKITPIKYSKLRSEIYPSTTWLTYSGSYNGQRHSQLSLINKQNIKNLKVKWIYQPALEHRVLEASPIVNDGIMYITTPPNNVIALDATTGRQLWVYKRKLPNDLLLCCGMVNRGLAALGNKLYLGSLDAHLVALNATTGEVIWDKKVADYRKGYSITGAPLALKNKIIVGIAGGEYGIRGFLDAYEAQTGKWLWRFYTIPGPGEPNHNSCSNSNFKKYAS